ncbi:MAG: Rieske 2Fe-2S domain-containing protein [Nitriliruptorales bacterium]|nr:Rieske 2Fe-2S domain-containing protein [Nitriliruptorales bacterium]
MTPERTCPACGDGATEPSARFCGRCGALLPTEQRERLRTEVGDEASSEPLPTPAESSADDAGGPTTRRAVLAGLGGVTLGLVGGAVLASRASEPDPTARLPEATFRVGAASDIVQRVAADGPILLPVETPRVAIVTWDPAATTEGLTARDVYGENGEGQPIFAATGLMALSLISTHQGCRVLYCTTSGWFEDPCHGSKWNAWGEWTTGPAPRGLDRFGASVEDGGMLAVDLTVHVPGRPRQPRFESSDPRGPSCVDL